MNKNKINVIPFLILISLFYVFSFSGCKKKQQTIYHTNKKESNQKHLNKQNYETLIDQIKHQEISTPVGFNLVKMETQNVNPRSWTYYGTLDIKKILDFYKQELETTGWNFKDLSIKNKGILICNKPSKTCLILISSQSFNSSEIHIILADEEIKKE